MTQPQNRLGIGHLMLWMATTSVVIAMGQWDLSTAGLPDNLLAGARLRTLVWSLGFGPLQGLALAGVLIFLWRRFKSHVPFPTEPGHWLLVIAGGERLMFLVTQSAYLLAVRGHESEIPPWANRLSEVAYHVFPILLAGVAACHVKSGWAWQLSILAMGVLGAMTIFHDEVLDWLNMGKFMGSNAASYALRFGYSLPGILAVVAVVIDRRQKQPRDFFHWCGVALVVLGPIVEWLRTLLMR
jgi:hypothetical protein